jgi:hypothetical protein
MAKYVFVYHGGGAPESEVEGAAVMQAWTEWFGSLGSAVVDAGHPTGESGHDRFRWLIQSRWWRKPD